jgi:hypothetical protein
VLWHLRQYHPLHLQVCILLAKEDLAFLQRPIKVNELFGPEARDACLGKEVMLDSLGLNTIGVTFREYLSRGVLKGH